MLALPAQAAIRPPLGAPCWASNFAAARPWKTCFYQAKMYGLLHKWMAAYKYSVVFCTATKPTAGVTARLFPALKRGSGLGGWVAWAGSALKGGAEQCALLWRETLARRTEKLLLKPQGAAQKLNCCHVMAAVHRGTKQIPEPLTPLFHWQHLCLL